LPLFFLLCPYVEDCSNENNIKYSFGYDVVKKLEMKADHIHEEINIIRDAIIILIIEERDLLL